MATIASILLGILLGLTISLWHRFNSFRHDVTGFISEIRTVLLGYEKSGGLIAELSELRRESATVDARIANSRHQLRGELNAHMMELENKILVRIDQLEGRMGKFLDERVG